MKKVFLIVVVLVKACIFIHAQILVPDFKVKLPAAVNETSGIEWINDSIWVTHNDSGDDALLYFLDKDGNLKGKSFLKNATNIDWEDLTFDGKENLYISDLGNNINSRKNLRIYRYNIKDSSVKEFRLNYADQKFPTDSKNKNFDCEAIVLGRDQLFSFTKNYTNPYNGFTKCYGIDLMADESSLTTIDSISLGDEGFMKNSVTGADLSNDEKTLALLTYNYLYLFYDYPDHDFFKGKYLQFHLPEIQQREAVSFDSIGNIWMTDERSRLKNGGYLYYYDLQKFYSGEQFYRKPEMGIVSIKLNENYIDLQGLEKCQFSLSAEITKDGTYTIDILKNGQSFKTYWNEWKATDKKIELEYYLGESVNSKINYSIRIYRNNNLVYQSKIKL